MKIYSRFPSFYSFLVVVLVLYFHHAALAQEKPAANLPFFGLQPKELPQILLPGVVSSVLSEYNGTFSPDGTEFFYTSEFNGKGTLVHMKLDQKKGLVRADYCLILREIFGIRSAFFARWDCLVFQFRKAH